METTEVMTQRQVAEYLQISERTLTEWIRLGKIPADIVSRIGGKLLRFTKSDIDAWIEQQKGGDING